MTDRKMDPDKQVSQFLADRFRFESRRSFMSQLTRVVFGTVGVAIASKLSIFNVKADDHGLEDFALREKAYNWRHCGLHGYLCSGNCSGGSTGIGYAAAWSVCCENRRAGTWSCCRYTDQCGPEPPNWGIECIGTVPSGAAWCGGVAGVYICTQVSCTGSYTCLANCSCSSNPDCG